MAVFTSVLERRLWTLAAAVVTTIYATLGLAGSLPERLGSDDLAAAVFIVGMLLVAAATIVFALRTRPSTGVVAAALGIAAVYVMVPLRLTLAERSHLFEYGVVAILIFAALSERIANGSRVRYPSLVAIISAALVGAIDEGIQALLPNRVFDIQDIGFNALAGSMAVMAALVLMNARRWSTARRRSRSG